MASQSDPQSMPNSENGASVIVEVFPGANGNTLVIAFSDQRPLPFDPAAGRPEPGEIDRLQADHRTAVPDVPRRQEHCAASLLPAPGPGRPAAGRQGAVGRARLRHHWP